ncbi:hypothetical protein [Reyranella sp.]|uniref:hypothetical protein n=1 Tax=Reyranella sp. TaxID=1929291 RepID=UPI003D0C1537
MAAQTSFRGRVDRRTRRLTLPVPSGLCTFSIAGCWGNPAIDGNGSAVVKVHCRSEKTGQHASFRLTRDASFDLPATDGVVVEVLQAVNATSLEVSVATREAPSAAPKAPAPGRYRHRLPSMLSGEVVLAISKGHFPTAHAYSRT